MSALSPVAASSVRRSSVRRLARIAWHESRLEFLKAVRMPAYAIPTLAFPWTFYLLFGVAFGSRMAEGMTMPTYLLATYGAFGVIGASLFGFGAGVAAERGQGWLLAKMASPMPPMAYFLAKVVMSLLFGVIILAGLMLLALTVGGVELEPLVALRLGVVLLVGALPFCGIGLAIGFLAGPSSAAPIVNLIYLPMAFCSGLWVPLAMLPEIVQQVAPFLPAYHLGQLALGALGGEAGSSPAFHATLLLLFLVASLCVAWFAFTRDEGKTWG